MELRMRIIVATAVIGLSLAVASGVHMSPALAADNVTIGIGNGGVAFGYSDGYWDRGHQWHNWENRAAADRFRAENRDHYYDRKHDSDRDAGWRDSDRYWDHH
jgi:hypothetical protein